jgi:sigma-B regulation protein RsbU (phosphoserine phosphatase)
VRHGAFEIASEAFAARHLSGDFISVREAGDNISLTLGDISGKGFTAGMWVTLLMGLVEMHRLTSAEPKAIAAGINGDLCRLSLGTPFVSMFLAQLGTVRGTLNYCSAGHPPALLLREDGRLESLSDGGPLLGVVPEASFIGGCVELRHGDVLLVYSDGLIESRNNSEQEFGLEHLESRLRAARRGAADSVLFSLLAAVQDFAGACPQADDMSLVVIRRLD